MTLDEAMERRGVTAAQVADRVGVRVQAVYRWRNNTRRMRPEHAQVLSEWLGVPAMDLLLGKGA